MPSRVLKQMILAATGTSKSSSTNDSGHEDINENGRDQGCTDRTEDQSSER